MRTGDIVLLCASKDFMGCPDRCVVSTGIKGASGTGLLPHNLLSSISLDSLRKRVYSIGFQWFAQYPTLDESSLASRLFHFESLEAIPHATFSASGSDDRTSNMSKSASAVNINSTCDSNLAHETACSAPSDG
ncbi:unnamed protein product, partial [Protopolystoma xenopodis]